MPKTATWIESASEAGATVLYLQGAWRLPNDAPALASRADVAACATATLRVSPTTAAAFYDTGDIVYSRSPATRSYYQLSHWTEPPSVRLGALLTDRLARSGAFRSVAAATDGVRGTLLMSTHLEEMYHDAATSPGTAKISLTAALIDPARRTVAAQRRFTGSAAATTHDAAGAVQGFELALGLLLDEVVEWAGSAAAQAVCAP